MAHGHPEARHYPVPLLWQESRIVVKRINRDAATQASLTQLAIGSVLSEKAGKRFSREIKKLMEP